MRRGVFVTVIVGVAIVAVVAAVFWRSKNEAMEVLPPSAKIETRIVRGQSLDPLIPEGAEVKIAFDSESKVGIQKDDVVAVRIGNAEDPLIKIVRGMPGAKLALKKVSESTWNILVDDKVVRNSEGKPYMVGDSGYRMLSLYINDYKGVIPANAYLLLGDRPSGSRDSTAFGLVDRSDILGKVIR